MVLPLGIAMLNSCHSSNELNLVRPPKDTVGFAHLDWQMDSIVSRIIRSGADTIGTFCKDDNPLKLAICPHDDYSLAGPLYYSVIKDIHAKIVIMFGVAHKARIMGIENKIVFGNYNEWKSPKGKILIDNEFQNEILGRLDSSVYMINDSLQKQEHSLEAITPFLEYFSPNVKIIPILIPAMPIDRMEEVSHKLASAIAAIVKKNKQEWGKDMALVISTDAVHYGDEDWGGKNYAPFGSDTLGYWMAVDHEKAIIKNSLTGELNKEKCRQFYSSTIQENNFREYKWTWCGRYSVPFGLLTAYELGRLEGIVLSGCKYGYSTSLDHKRIRVEDLRMGLTSPVKLRHWVGYAAVGYR